MFQRFLNVHITFTKYMQEKEFVFVLGGPGSGKGTQSLQIAKEYNIGYLSTGDLLRAAVQPLAPGAVDTRTEAEKEMNEHIKNLMKNGQLVPDEVVLDLVKLEIQKQDRKYFFLDGFPRSIAQAEKFEQQIGKCRAVLFLDVPDDVLLSRLVKRGETSGRADDNEEAAKKRLVTYHNVSYPVIDHYSPKGMVIKLNGNRTIRETHDDIIAQLRSALHWEL